MAPARKTHTELTSEPPISFGYWVRRLRRALDMTQADLADLVGCVTMTIRRIEGDLRRPSRQLAERLADFLAVPAEQRAAWLRAAHGELTLDQLPLSARPIAATQPARTRRIKRAELPIPASPLIGRAAALHELRELLARRTLRLLTLVGAGGVGKSRLALELAWQLSAHQRGRVCWLSLAPVQDAQLLPDALVQALGLAPFGDQPARDQLLAWLAPRRMLLVLDACELLAAPAGALIAQILEECAGVRVLATSRAPLRVQAEQLYEVVPLDDAAALRLFRERAAAVRPDFVPSEHECDQALTICRRLDRLPLAIELAAGRMRLYSVEMLDRMLEQHGALAVLRGGPRDSAAHHRTLQDAIAWSYTLLDPPAQALFRALGLWVGGWTIAAIDRLVGPGKPSAESLLEELLDHALVHRSPGSADEPRFSMFDTIREFANAELAAAGEQEQGWQRYADQVAALCEAAAERYHTPEQVLAIEQFEAEITNARAVLGWALDATASLERRAIGLRLVWALCDYWRVRGPWDEAEAWLARALRCARGAAPLLRARALAAAAAIGLLQVGLFGQGEARDVEAQLAEALELARALGDRRLEELSLWRLSLWCLWSTGDLVRAQSYADSSRALAAELGEMRIGFAAHQQGRVALALGQAEGGWALLEQGLAHARRAQIPYEIADILTNMALWACRLARPRHAQPLADEALAIYRRIGAYTHIPITLQALAWALEAQGRLGEAQRTAEEYAQAVRRLASPAWQVAAELRLAWLALLQGDLGRSQLLAEQAAALARSLTAPAPQLQARRHLALLAYARGEVAEAAAAAAHGLAEARAINHELGAWLALAGLVAAQRGQLADAAALLEERLARCALTAYAEEQIEAHTALGQIYLAAGDLAAAKRHLGLALPGCIAGGLRRILAALLEQMATLRSISGDHAGAARWWGAADTLRIEIGAPRWPVERSVYAQRIADCHATLGDAAFVEAWQAGATLAWPPLLAELRTLVGECASPGG